MTGIRLSKCIHGKERNKWGGEGRWWVRGEECPRGSPVVEEGEIKRRLAQEKSDTFLIINNFRTDKYFKPILNQCRIYTNILTFYMSYYILKMLKG